MHICVICIEFFGDSVYGGFGRATRCIGTELAKRGLRVSVVVPRRSPERPDRYTLDGMTVHQIAPGPYGFWVVSTLMCITPRTPQSSLPWPSSRPPGPLM